MPAPSKELGNLEAVVEFTPGDLCNPRPDCTGQPDALLGELLERFPDGASPPGMLAGMQSAGGRSLQAAD